MLVAMLLFLCSGGGCGQFSLQVSPIYCHHMNKMTVASKQRVCIIHRPHYTAVWQCFQVSMVFLSVSVYLSMAVSCKIKRCQRKWKSFKKSGPLSMPLWSLNKRHFV
jgi:hypothetical protein